MTTRGGLKIAIARDIRDPSNKTFDDATLGDLIDQATAEVSLIAPARFQEDITPVLNALNYTVQSGVFASPETNIELKRVEIWDGTQLPIAFTTWLVPRSQGYVNASEAGWEFWNGVLSLTGEQYDMLTIPGDLLRVWGYRPYPRLTDDTVDAGMSFEVEMAARAYARVEGLRSLSSSRELFTQWQTHSNNSDVSPASLMGLLNQAETSWQHRAHRITVIRGGS